MKGGAKDFTVPGFRAAGISCGVKKSGKKDLALITSDLPASVAAVYTTNKVKAAPVVYDMRRTRKGHSRGIVVNSGNANACTGPEGYQDAGAMAKAGEKALGLKSGQMLVSSTGVIGVPLPVDRITRAMDEVTSKLSPDGFSDAAEAIMTTDAFPKKARATFKVGRKAVTVLGIAKGAGMICPDMATMLAFFTTDAAVSPAVLRKVLREAVDKTFNSIIVDNDTSTNDMAVAFANGASGAGPLAPGRPGYRRFVDAFGEVAGKLARMIVSDGEGATRFVEVRVEGAASGTDAKRAARTISTSMLVKTALFGGDPNWGRIIAALGRAGIRLNPDKVEIALNGVNVVKDGVDTGAEARAAKAIDAPEVEVVVKLDLGRGTATVWTTDLSYEYVKINSQYRT